MALNPEYIQIGDDIIKAAYKVRNNLSRYLREDYYEAALTRELEKLNHKVERQVAIPAVYDGQIVDNPYKADLLVDGRVIIELKALSQMGEREMRQILTYLSLTNIHLGYLINFGARDFKFGRAKDPLPYKMGLYRVVNNMEDYPNW